MDNCWNQPLKQQEHDAQYDSIKSETAVTATVERDRCQKSRLSSATASDYSETMISKLNNRSAICVVFLFTTLLTLEVIGTSAMDLVFLIITNGKLRLDENPKDEEFETARKTCHSILFLTVSFISGQFIYWVQSTLRAANANANANANHNGNDVDTNTHRDTHSYSLKHPQSLKAHRANNVHRGQTWNNTDTFDTQAFFLSFTVPHTWNRYSMSMVGGLLYCIAFSFQYALQHKYLAFVEGVLFAICILLYASALMYYNTYTEDLDGVNIGGTEATDAAQNIEQNSILLNVVSKFMIITMAISCLFRFACLPAIFPMYFKQSLEQMFGHHTENHRFSFEARFMLTEVVLRFFGGSFIWLLLVMSIYAFKKVHFESQDIFASAPYLFQPVSFVAIAVLVPWLCIEFGVKDSDTDTGIDWVVFVLNCAAIASMCYLSFSLTKMNNSASALIAKRSRKKSFDKVKVEFKTLRKRQLYAIWEGIALCVFSIISCVCVIGHHIAVDDHWDDTHLQKTCGILVAIVILNILQLIVIGILHTFQLSAKCKEAKYWRHLSTKRKYRWTLTFLAWINVWNFLYFFVVAVYYFQWKTLMNKGSAASRTSRLVAYGFWFAFPCFHLWCVDQYCIVLRYIDKTRRKTEQDASMLSAANSQIQSEAGSVANMTNRHRARISLPQQHQHQHDRNRNHSQTDSHELTQNAEFLEDNYNNHNNHNDDDDDDNDDENDDESKHSQLNDISMTESIASNSKVLQEFKDRSTITNRNGKHRNSNHSKDRWESSETNRAKMSRSLTATV